MKRIIPTYIFFLVTLMTMMVSPSNLMAQGSQDVLIQGFNWESAKNPSGWWGIVESKAVDLKNSKIDVIWLPPSSDAASLEGYLPRELYDLNSEYGTQAELQSLINSMHGQNLKVLADIVINHRVGSTDWADFTNPTWGCWAVTANDEWGQNGGNPCGNNDTGNPYSAARDIDHTNPTVQADIEAWMGWLKNTIGYDGWRYDYVHGFHGSYVGQYNDATSPYLSVGELWDPSRQVIQDWINETGQKSTAFDFSTKGIMHDALNNNYWKLNDNGNAPGLIGWSPSKSVTFLDNHDTGSTQGYWPFDGGKIMEGYAYILTHPGIPMVFWDHFYDWPGLKNPIRELIKVRKDNGLHSESNLSIQTATNDVYAAIIDGKVAMKIGPGSWTPSGSDWTIKASGTNYAVWDKAGVVASDPIVEISPASGNYAAPLAVTITSVDGADPVNIYYTTDGSTPTASSSLYTSAVSLNSPSNLCAIAIDTDGRSSTVVCENYTFDPILPFTVYFEQPTGWGTPLIHHWSAVPTGVLANSVWPGVAMVNEGGGWYSFTFNNVESSSFLFHDNTGGVNQSDDFQRGIDGWYMNGIWLGSDPRSSNNAPVTSISPVGPYSEPTPFSVTITATDDSGIAPTIYYTTDGTTPSLSSPSAVGSTTINISTTTITTVQYFAEDDQGLVSATEAHDYNVQSNTPPTLSVFPVGPYSSSAAFTATLTGNDFEGGVVTIYYTLDGSTPSSASLSALNSLSLNITGNTTVNAYAVDPLGLATAIQTHVYTITEAPTVSVSPAGPVTSATAINATITATDNDDPNPVIYYTIDGTTPNASSSSAVSTASLTFSVTTVLKFYAEDASGNASPIETHVYTIDSSTPPSGGDYFTWDNASVYFVVTDRFNDGDPSNNQSYGRQYDEVGGWHGGDLKGLTQKVNDGYFTDLGINAIWITPPYENTHGHVPPYGDEPLFQRHYSYHGYYALDFTEIDANMGTQQDFKDFVDAAHDKGIRILMDIVMNHVGYETPEDIAEFGFGDMSDFENPSWCNWWGDEWIRKGDTPTDFCAAAGGGGDLLLPLAGLPDIQTERTTAVGLPPILQTKWNAAKESQEVAELDAFFSDTGLPRTPVNHIVKWLTDWVREYGVDGFRLDTYKHIEREHWGTLKDVATDALQEWKTNNPSKALDNTPFWMVGEWYGHGIGKNADVVVNGKTDAVINFNFQGQGGDLASIDGIYASYASVANPDPDWNFLSYISSHDTELSDRSKLIAEGTTFMMCPGGIQLFYGDETARPVGPGPGDQPTRSFMNWNSINTDVLSHWQTLGQFRRKHASIGAGSHQKLSDSPYTFTRLVENADVQDQVVVVMGATGSTAVDVSAVWPDGTVVHDFYTDVTATVTGGTVTFTSHSNGVILIEDPNPVIRPTIAMSPANGSYDPAGHTVTITSSSLDNASSTIYYTTDPNASSADLSTWMVYTGPISVTTNTTIKAVAVKDTDGELSRVITHDYWVSIPSMTVYYYNDGSWPNVNMYYWECEPDGANPPVAWPGVAMTETCPGWYEYTLPAGALSCNVIFTCGSNGCQSGDLTVNGGTSWYKSGAWYTSAPSDFCNLGPTVSITPTGGNYCTTPSINVSGNTSDGSSFTIYYTTDGTTPSSSSAVWTSGTSLPSSSFTLSAIAIDASGDASNVVTENYNIGDFAPTLTVSPAGPQTFMNTIDVTITSVDDCDPSGTIYYTTDGSTPTTSSSSALGTTTLTFSATTTLNVFAVDSGGNATAVETHQYDIIIVPAMTVYFKNEGAWADVNIYYWECEPVDHNAPIAWPGVPMTQVCGDWYEFSIPAGADMCNIIFNCGNSTCQTADLSTNNTQSWYSGGSWSTAAPADFCATNQAPTATISPAGGTFSCSAPTVTINTTDPDGDAVTVYYTTDGSSPTSSSSVWTSGASLPTSSFSLNAIAIDVNGSASAVATAAYTIVDNAPSLAVSPAGPQTFTSSINVSLTASDDCDSSNGTIYYTTDGSTPTTSSPSASGSTSMTFTTTTTLQAIVVDANGNASVVQTHVYSLNGAPTNTVSPAGPLSTACSQAVTVTATDDSGIAPTIYYTTDGTTPNASSATATGVLSLTFTTSTTLKFYSEDNGGQTSSIESHTYTIVDNAPSLAVSPAGPQTFTSSINVSLTASDDCDGSGGTIYYTTDGSTPTTSSSSASGSTSMTFTTTTTLQAMVVDANGNASAVQTHVYSLNGAPTTSVSPVGPLSTACSQAVTVTATDDSGIAPTIYYTTDGSTPNASSATATGVLSLTFTTSTTLKFYSEDNGGQTSSIESHTYTIVDNAPSLAVSPAGPQSFASSINVGLTASDDCDSSNGTIYYTTDGSTPTTSSPSASGSTSMTFTATTTLQAMVVDANGNASAVQTHVYTINGVPTTSVSPAGPLSTACSQAVTVTATDDSGMTTTIYYTTDGSAPTTSSASASASLSLTFTTSTTLKFFAEDNTGQTSATESHTYTIVDNAPTVSVSPGSQTFTSSVTVSITSSDDCDGTGGTIYYTVDGSTPTTSSSSAVGSSSLTFSSTTTLKVFAVDANGNISAIDTYDYTLAAPSGFTVYFRKPTSWGNTPNIHYWDVMPAGAYTDTTWPGESMTPQSGNWYSYTFTGGATSTNLVFNDNGSPQTADLSATGDTWFILDEDGTLSTYTSDPRDNPPASYDLSANGHLDHGASWYAGDNGLNLFADYNGTDLYLAANNAGSLGRDVFLIVSDNPNALQTAQWSKAGMVAGSNIFLANESDNNYNAWFDASGVQSANSNHTSGVYLEGTIDIQAEFGSVSKVYVVAAAYNTNDGGSLELLAGASNNSNGDIEAIEFIEIDLGVARPSAAITKVAHQLHQNYPNPFDSDTFFGFDLGQDETASLRLVDITGRKIWGINQKEYAKGFHKIRLNKYELNLSKGIYFFQLEVGEQTFTKKMIVY